MAINSLSETNKLRLNLDLRVVSGLLLLALIASLLMWRPWATSADSNDRTVQVTGESKITSEPDEYVFYPNYDVKNADRATALAELSKKSDQVVSKLKELGIKENKIKTNTDGYDYPTFPEKNPDTTTYNLRMTITVANREEAQKIQNYLITTSPTGSVSPQTTFSEVKRKELENKAREEAAKDARSKAERMAKNIGFNLGKVKSIADGSGFSGGGPITLMAEDSSARSSAPQLGVQPGENDFRFSISVTYFVK